MALAAVVSLAGCGGSSAASVHPSPLVLPSGTGVAPSTSPRAGLPPEAAATQGSTYYAVFLAVAPTAQDDRLVQAQSRAKALGYEGGVGGIDCTPGARAQLRLAASGDYTAFSVLFATKAQADAFAGAYGSGVVGIAHVSVGCLD